MKIAALVMAIGLTAPAAAGAETRFAFLVGHNIGNLHETPLRWAESDATRMLGVLTEIGNVREDRAELLLAPTRRELERGLLKLEGRIEEAENRGEHTVVFFYFSGHADREELHLASEKIRIDEIEKILEDGPASTVVSVIDACQNDRSPRVRNKGAVRAPSFSWPSEGVGAPEGFVRVRSASEGEVAQESDDLQGSLFTHHLLSGMRGSADLDRDGTVSLSEVYRYGYNRTLADSHGQATAVQHGRLDVKLAGRGTLVFTYPRRAISALRFADDIRGHVLVIDDTSARIVAESHLSEDGARLALAPGKYRIQVRRDGAVYSGLVALGTGERRVLMTDLSAQPVLAVLTKGSRYDPHPYVMSVGAQVGRSQVSGFDASGGLRIGLDYRVSDSVRGAVSLDVGYANASNPLWDYRQAETALLVGIDWVGQVSSATLLTFGVRAGVASIFQSGARSDADRLTAAGYSAEDVEDRAFALGPKIAVVLGAEYHPWSRVGWRLAVEPSGVWLEDRGGVELRYGASAVLALLVRL